jgi:hypothetical protein
LSQEITRANNNYALAPAQWQVYKEMAAHAFKSGFFKAGSQDAAITVMMQGIELGLQPMAALNNIYIVNGRPSLKAQLMAALIIRAGHPPVETLESTDKIAKVRFRRSGSDNAVDVAFTIEQANKAGLAGKDSWKSYPEDMLWNRAVARGARRVFPELFAGLYTPDEMQYPTTEVIEAETIPPTRNTSSTVTTVEEVKDLFEATEVGNRDNEKVERQRRAAEIANHTGLITLGANNAWFNMNDAEFKKGLKALLGEDDPTKVKAILGVASLNEAVLARWPDAEGKGQKYSAILHLVYDFVAAVNEEQEEGELVDAGRTPA